MQRGGNFTNQYIIILGHDHRETLLEVDCFLAVHFLLINRTASKTFFLITLLKSNINHMLSKKILRDHINGNFKCR